MSARLTTIALISVIVFPLFIGTIFHVFPKIADQIFPETTMNHFSITGNSISYKYTSEYECRSNIAQFDMNIEFDEKSFISDQEIEGIYLFNSALNRSLKLTCDSNFYCTFNEVFSINCQNINDVDFFVEFVVGGEIIERIRLFSNEGF